MNERYEVTGPIQKIEQRKPCVSGLEHLLNFDSFDVEFSPSGKVIQTTNYMGSGSIQSSEHFLYDDDDNLVESLSFDSAGSKKSSTIFRYDGTGKAVGWITYDGSGAVTRTGTQTYRGELLVSLASIEGNGSPVLEKTFEYVNGKLAKSVGRYYGTGGNLDHVWISYYNPSELITETFALTAEGKPLGDGRYKYEYDPKGRERKIWCFNDWAEDDVPNAVFVFEYTVDEHENWTERSKHHRSKSDSRWTTQVTKRTLTYFPQSDRCR